MPRSSLSAQQKRERRAQAGRLIREARAWQGLTAAEVEYRLGMYPRPDGGSYLAAVEAGQMELLERYRAPLCELLGIPESALPAFRGGDERRE